MIYLQEEEIMSTIFTVKTDKIIELKEVFDQLIIKYRNLSAEEIDDNCVYFYLNGMSIRGVYVFLKKSGFEIKHNVLSNNFDMELTNDLINCISEKTNGKVYDENNNLLNNNEYIKKETVENKFLKDLETIFLYIKETGTTIEFPGTTRSFFIGKKLYNAYKDFGDAMLVQIFQKIILFVLYGLPKYYECTSFGAESKIKDKPIKLKMLTSNDNFIIQDYDYIMIGNENENNEDSIVMISVENINKVLPKDWQIVDECTIVANKLDDNGWMEFRIKCKENNNYLNFKKEAK
jgi:hypothetical protein